MTFLRDPWRRSIVLAAAIAASGLVALAIGAAGVRGSLSVPEQVSFAMSGGIGGAALTGAGLALLDIQRRRYESAQERHQLGAIATELGEIAELLATRRAAAVATPTPARGAPQPAPTSSPRRRPRTLRAR